MKKNKIYRVFFGPAGAGKGVQMGLLKASHADLIDPFTMSNLLTEQAERDEELRVIVDAAKRAGNYVLCDKAHQVLCHYLGQSPVLAPSSGDNRMILIDGGLRTPRQVNLFRQWVGEGADVEIIHLALSKKLCLERIAKGAEDDPDRKGRTDNAPSVAENRANIHFRNENPTIEAARRNGWNVHRFDIVDDQCPVELYDKVRKVLGLPKPRRTTVSSMEALLKKKSIPFRTAFPVAA